MVWHLRDCHQSQIWAYGSSVYLRWSEKLGLELKCSDQAQAARMVARIKQVGRIKPDLWAKAFYPTWGWGRTTLMD
jgi:hypothetical protein